MAMKPFKPQPPIQVCNNMLHTIHEPYTIDKTDYSNPANPLHTVTIWRPPCPPKMAHLPEESWTIDAAHRLLDEHGFPSRTPVGNHPLTLYGRLIQRMPHKDAHETVTDTLLPMMED